jgi:hypothetical protein
MLRNCQDAFCPKNYNFTGFGEDGLQILHCKVGISQAIGRTESQKSRYLLKNAGNSGRARPGTKE